MRAFKVVGFILIFLFAFRLASAADVKEPQPLPTPIVRAVDPATVKPGEIATISGDNLDQSRVKEVYLTTGTVDVKVQIVDQSATAIKFKVPAKTAPARYTIMVLLAGDEPRLLEEPVRLTVE
jgi:hypothetical protein